MVKRIGWIAPVGMSVTLMAFLFFAASLTAQTAASPQTTKQMVPDNPSEHTPPVQPIAYSHKKHLAFVLECKKCHTNPEPGKLMTFPAPIISLEYHVTHPTPKPS